MPGVPGWGRGVPPGVPCCSPALCPGRGWPVCSPCSGRCLLWLQRGFGHGQRKASVVPQ